MVKALTVVLSVRGHYAKWLLDERVDIALRGEVLADLLRHDYSFWRPGDARKGQTPRLLAVVVLVDEVDYHRITETPARYLRPLLRIIVQRDGLQLVKVLDDPAPGPVLRPGGATAADVTLSDEAHLARAGEWRPDDRPRLRVAVDAAA